MRNPQMNRIVIFIIFTTLCFLRCDSHEAVKPKKPNIVFLLADDMGYGDFEKIGGATETPNLNRLADDGVFFSNFYAAGPNCSPSRTGLMTGKTPPWLVCIATDLPITPCTYPMKR